MCGSVVNEDVPCAERDFRAVVDAKPDFALEHDHDVDAIGVVKSMVIAFPELATDAAELRPVDGGAQWRPLALRVAWHGVLGRELTYLNPKDARRREERVGVGGSRIGRKLWHSVRSPYLPHSLPGLRVAAVRNDRLNLGVDRERASPV